MNLVQIDIRVRCSNSKEPVECSTQQQCHIHVGAEKHGLDNDGITKMIPLKSLTAMNMFAVNNSMKLIPDTVTTKNTVCPVSWRTSQRQMRAIKKLAEPRSDAVRTVTNTTKEFMRMPEKATK